MQRSLLAFLFALVFTSPGCAGRSGPPLGRVVATFEAFAPRTAGRIGGAEFIGDVSTDASAAESMAGVVDGPAPGEPLRARFAQERLTNEGRRGSYLARFDGPLCPRHLGPDVAEAAPLTVQRKTASGWAEVSGQTIWRSDRLLAFEADETFAAATRYRISGAMSPCPGARIDEPWRERDVTRWEHELVHLPLEVHVQGTQGRRILANAPIRVTVTHPVTEADLRASMSVRAEPWGEASPSDAGPVPIELIPRGTASEAEPGTRSYDLVPSSSDGVWPAQVMLRIEVAPDLRSPVGPEPLGREVTATRGIGRALAVSPDCSEDCDPGQSIELSTTRALRSEDVERIRVSPRPPGLSRFNRHFSTQGPGDDAGGVRLDGVLRPNTRYRVTLPAGLRDEEGTAFERAEVIEVRTGEVSPIFGFDDLGIQGSFADAPEPDEGPTPPVWNVDGYAPRGPGWGLDILEASRPMTVGVFGRRVLAYEVRVAAIEPALLPTWLESRNIEKIPWPQAQQVGRAEIPMQPRGATEYASQALDLAPLVGDARGVFVVQVRATKLRGAGSSEGLGVHRKLVMLTDLAPTVAESTTRTTVRVRKLGDDAPVAGATVRLLVPTAVADDPAAEAQLGKVPKLDIVELGVTDAQGELHARGQAPPVSATTYILVDGPDGDRAALELWSRSRSPVPSDSITRLGESVTGKLAAERGIYRPGETMHLLGWSTIHSPWAPLRLRGVPEGTTVRVTVNHERLGDIAFADVETGPHGKFSADIELPSELGAGALDLQASVIGAEGRIGGARAKVEDFRVPTFWVRATEGVHDGEADPQGEVIVRAHAYSGGPVPVIDVTRQHECRWSRPSPRDYGLNYEWAVGEPRSGEASTKLQLSLISPPTLRAPAHDGEVRLGATFGELPPAVSLSCSVDVALTDTTLQAYGDQAYLGRTGEGAVVALHTDDKHFSHEGTHVVTLRGLELGGARVAMSGVSLELRRSAYDEDEKPVSEVDPCVVDLRATGEDARCEFPRLEPGSYVLVATSPEGVKTRMSIYANWVEPGRNAPPPERDVKSVEQCEPAADGEDCAYVTEDLGFTSKNRPRELSVHPRWDYVRVGDRLQVAVRGPWPGAAGTLLVGEGGHLGRHPFVLKNGRAEVELLADEQWVGGVSFYAWLPRRGKSRLPRLETAMASVNVSEASRTLAVEFEVAGHAEAGATLPIGLRVFDRDGAPASAGRVSLWMVDKAVLDLTNYRIPRIDHWLGPKDEEDSETFALDDAVTKPFKPRRSDPGTGWGASGYGSGYGSGSGFGSGGGVGGSSVGAQADRVTRDRFATTPLFLADVALDAKGRAATEVTLPGNLTRFEVMAVATGGLPGAGPAATSTVSPPGRYGVGSTSVEVDLPFSVRLALPRQLRPGDRTRLGAVLVNRADRARTVEVIGEVKAGPLSLLGSTRRELTVPAQGRSRVDFDALAGGDGEALVRVAVRDIDEREVGSFIDAESRKIPVRHERLRDHRDAFAGELEPGRRGARTIKVPIDLPPRIDPTKVQVEISLATTRMLELGPTLAALSSYPYGCTEQTASSMLAGIAAAGPRLASIYPEVARKDHVEAGVLKLSARQRTDGSFGYWSASSPTHPWASIHATWVLARAQTAGFDVPEQVLRKAQAHVRELATRAPEPDEMPWERETRRFAAWTLADVGAVEGEVTEPAHKEVKDEATARVEIDEVLRRHADDVLARADAGAEERALIAYALHRVSPEDPVVDRLMTALRRQLTLVNGRAFVHPDAVGVGLGDTFRSEARAIAFTLIAVLEVSPDDALADRLAMGLLEQRFGGTWGDTQSNAFALLALERWGALREGQEVALEAQAWLTRRRLGEARLRGPSTQVVKMDGPLVEADERGRPALTLRVRGRGKSYFQTTLQRLRPVDERPPDRGLHISATLRDADGPVAGQTTAGTLLALDVEVVVDTATRFVVADVPIPAGLELVRTDLANQMHRMPIEGERGDWVSHVERRGDRVIVYGDQLVPGAHRTTVFVRATAEGTYRWPGARAAAMYDPAVEGWSASRSFEITARP